MASRLPALYTLIIVVELLGLSWLYVTDPPSSSSGLGIALGWGALASMIVMLVYSLARRSKRLREVARLSIWLHFHIFLGVQGMLFAFFHSVRAFTGERPVQLLNPAVLNFFAVVVVFLSGIFGRYLYSLVPRTLDGEERALKEIEAELLNADAASGDVEGRKARTEARIARLRQADALFQRWIVLHRPIAAVMYVLSAIHVALSYMFTPTLGSGG